MNGFRSGEIIIILVALGFFVMIPVLVAAVVFFGVRRAKNDRSAWKRLAAKLNLTVSPSAGLGLSGLYRGRRLDVAVGIRGGSESREVFTYCVTEFQIGLRLLLNIRSRALLDSLFGSGNAVKLGNDAFDDQFFAECYHPDVIRNFLVRDFPSVETTNLLGDLLFAGQTGLTIRIDDSQVYVEKRGDAVDEQRVLQMMETVVRLADRFEAARSSFPPAEWEIQAAHNWNQTAATLGLKFDRDAFRISGQHRGFPVQLSLTSKPGKWQTTLRAEFPSSLSIGLQIFSENSIHRAMAWIGAQDIRVGLEDFDQSFVVKTTNEGAARTKLQPDFCLQITNLRKISADLKVDDESITVVFDEVVGDGNALQSYIQAITTAAAMLNR